jgi:hypothetical protein
VQNMGLNEREWTDLLYHLTEEHPPDESISERTIKRGLRIKEVHSDIKTKLEKGGEFSPADFARSYILLMLLSLDYAGSVSLPYQDVFEWREFKKAFYEFTETFDTFFEFRKTKGRPNKSETSLLYFLGIFCRSHNPPTCDHRHACECNYMGLLSGILELRLARNQEWQERKGTERKNVFLRELKAARTAVNRFWLEFYGQKPPRLRKKDFPVILEFVSIGDPTARTVHLG